MATLNANPVVYHTKSSDASASAHRRMIEDIDGDHSGNGSDDEDKVDPVDKHEIFDLIRHINDPEHPLTLEQLNVTQLQLLNISNTHSRIEIAFTPTIPHCSMATLIGLCLRVKLIRALPPRFKVSISITPGTHASEEAINKQLNDKERVAAALENEHLLEVVNKCIKGTDKWPNVENLF